MWTTYTTITTRMITRDEESNTCFFSFTFFFSHFQSIVVSYFDSNITTIVFYVFNFSVNAIKMIEEREKQKKKNIKQTAGSKLRYRRPCTATAHHSPNLSLNNRDLVRWCRLFDVVARANVERVPARNDVFSRYAALHRLMAKLECISFWCIVGE